MNTAYMGTGIKLVRLEAGNEDAAWAEIQTHCSNLSDSGCQLLRSGLDPHVRSVLIEPHYVCRDFRNLFSHFYSKKFLERRSICQRLHFFGRSDLDERRIVATPDRCQDSYLGYSVIQPVPEGCLGRTVVDPLKLGRDPKRFYCLQTPTRTRINGAHYFVRGYPYIAQSGEALVCAHASLWGLCRYLSERYPVYAEVHPYDLIQMTASRAGRRVPYRGMTYSDYSEILTAFGCHPAILKPKIDRRNWKQDHTYWKQDREAFYDLYAYLESGFPILASFGGHVVTLVGHTMREDPREDLPDQDGYYNSFLLMKQLVVVDDNFFPYQLLEYHDTAQYHEPEYELIKPKISIDSIFVAVVPLPEKVFLTAGKARKLAYYRLREPRVKRCMDAVIKDIGATGEKLVARLFLTSGAAYKSRKRLCALGTIGGVPDKLSRFPVNLNLPHFIWVMEIGLLREYRKMQIVAEVVLDATACKKDEYIYIRVGNFILTPKWRKTEETGERSFLLYTHNLGERDA